MGDKPQRSMLVYVENYLYTTRILGFIFSRCSCCVFTWMR